MESKILKGTTTVGLTCKDGIVFATDRRASMGYLVASKIAKKAFNINGQVGATIAGSVGDANSLIRLMHAEARLYEMNNGKKMSTESVATLLSNILQGNKMFPYLVQILIGGFDKEARIFSLDPIGGLTEEKVTATGSGSPIAYGILERDFIEDKGIKDNIPIALNAMRSAIERDIATGNGIDLVTITGKGFKRYETKEIEGFLKQIKTK